MVRNSIAMIDMTSLDKKSCKYIVEQLSNSLANTYILYLKTQNFHWNLVDPRFYFLHKMLEEQYEDLASAVDDLAERIRTLGHKTPASMNRFLELGTLEEAEGDFSGDEMLRKLYQDHDTIAKSFHPLISKFNELGDDGSADMLIERLRVHEKTAWVLRSHFS